MKDPNRSTAALAARGAHSAAAIVNRLLRLPAVIAATGVSRSTIYAWIKRGLFPKPVRLGSNTVAWRAAEVEAWIADPTAYRQPA